MQLLYIGNPENRRCQYFLAAAKSQGFAAPFVVSYLDILQQQVNLDFYLQQSHLVRIDSPGENARVSRQFLKWAANDPLLGKAAHISAPAVDVLPMEKGRIQFIRQQHLGFVAFLNYLQAKLEQYPHIQVINGIKDIQLMFDKIACHQHFVQHHIAVPPAIYSIQNYEDLRAKMQEKAWNRVFIKPIHGSSASGVIAYRIKGQKEQAISSIELVQEQGETKLFNSLKIRTYNNCQDIAYLVNTLAKEGLIVEQWLPKASLEGGVFDLRMLVINGKVQHTVVRQSQSPMTNLHLGNQRATLTEVKTLLGESKWQQVCTMAEKASSCLSNTFYVGLDVMLSSTLKKIAILEANAFGDLLPNIFIEGRDSYAATLFHLKQQLCQQD